jgi:hypothetical protein
MPLLSVVHFPSLQPSHLGQNACYEMHTKASTSIFHGSAAIMLPYTRSHAVPLLCCPRSGVTRPIVIRTLSTFPTIGQMQDSRRCHYQKLGKLATRLNIASQIPTSRGSSEARSQTLLTPQQDSEKLPREAIKSLFSSLHVISTRCYCGTWQTRRIRTLLLLKSANITLTSLF